MHAYVLLSSQPLQAKYFKNKARRGILHDFCRFLFSMPRKEHIMNGFKVFLRTLILASAAALAACGGGGGTSVESTSASSVPVVVAPVVTVPVVTPPVVTPPAFPLALSPTPAPHDKLLFVARAQVIMAASRLYSLSGGGQPVLAADTRWASTISVSQKSGVYVFQAADSATAYYNRAGVLLASYPDITVAGVQYSWTPEDTVIFVSDSGLVEFGPSVAQLLVPKNESVYDWFSSPAVSPDGKYVVWSHHSADTTTLYLAEMAKLRAGLGLASAQVIWSGPIPPDDMARNRTVFVSNSEFIFAATTENIGTRPSTKIFLGNTQGTAPKAVITTPFLFGLVALELSPDRTKVAYSSLDRVIYVAKVGEWVATKVDEGYVGYKFDSLSWSPDGKYLAAGGMTLSSGGPRRVQVVVYQPGTTNKWQVAEVDGAGVPGLAWTH